MGLLYSFFHLFILEVTSWLKKVVIYLTIMATREPSKDSITRQYETLKTGLVGSISQMARIIADAITAVGTSFFCPIAFEMPTAKKMVKIKDNLRDSKSKWKRKKREAPKALPRTL